jgi:hypothetical protein
VVVVGARLAADGVDVRRRAGWLPAGRGWGRSPRASAGDDASGCSDGGDGGSSGGAAGRAAAAPLPARRGAPAAAAPAPAPRRGPPRAPPCPPAPDAWRAAVGSAAVAAAWERLSGAVVQEFVYDSFYSYLTPDREFPAAVRGLLNAAFGEAARRARSPRLDWGKVLVGWVAARWRRPRGAVQQAARGGRARARRRRRRSRLPCALLPRPGAPSVCASSPAGTH